MKDMHHNIKKANELKAGSHGGVLDLAYVDLKEFTGKFSGILRAGC